MKTEKMYMNVHTGSVDTYDNWWFTDSLGERDVNSVDMGLVVEVSKNAEGNWVEV